jgi:hypothetical protein
VNIRTLVVLALTVLLPPAARAADLQWHDFGKTDQRDTIPLGRVTIVVEERTNSASGSPGDDLVMTVQSAGEKPTQYSFTSAYGFGSVAIYKNVLFLKYGVGRGISAREDHVKVLRLDRQLDQVVDVQSSCYVLTSPHNTAPDLFEYRLKVSSNDKFTTLVLSLPKSQKGIPTQKIVRWKNDT